VLEDDVTNAALDTADKYLDYKKDLADA